MTTRPNPSHATRRPAGFTLVELLVVIGIIALLISILLPALNKARQSANQTKCMANMRSMGQALFLYTTVYKGSLPFGYVESGQTTPVNLGDGKTKYVGPEEDWSTLLLSVITSQRTNSQYAFASSSQSGARALFLCPEVSIEGSGGGRLTHFSAHPLLMPDIRKYSFYVRLISRPKLVIRGLAPYKLNRVRRPADIIVLFEGTLLNSTYGAYATVDTLHDNAMGNLAGTLLIEDYARTNPPENADTPVNMKPKGENVPGRRNSDFAYNVANIRFRHGGDTRTNALMMDGHVQTFNIRKDKPDNDCTDMKLRNICVPPPL